MKTNFKGTALITGVTEGIGKSLTELFIKENYFVVGVARNSDKLELMKSDFKNQFDYIKADLCNPKELQKVLDRIAADSFDVCINNAGLGGVGAFTEIPMDKHQEVLDLNISALVKISYSFLKTAKSGDALVNVSSVLAFAPLPNLGLYSGTKAFVTSFTETLYSQYKSKNIFVCSLHPGKTLTEFRNRAGGERDRRSLITQNPDQVAQCLWRALRAKCGPNIISGSMNKLAMILIKFLPRKLVLRIMSQID